MHHAAARAILACGLAIFGGTLALGAEQNRPLSFSELPGWSEDDHAAAWLVFRSSCAALVDKEAPLHSGKEQGKALEDVCRAALMEAEHLSSAKARTFFEQHFEPVKLGQGPRPGFMTAYYEPEFLASKIRTAQFTVPVLRRPGDLVSFSDAMKAPPGFEHLAAARKREDGSLEPYPDRAQIESGALAGKNLELFWLRDPFDLFTLQMQGSGRLHLADGTLVRLGNDGRNGHPYTLIGKVLIERGILQKGGVSMQAIGKAFEADPQLAREVMNTNKSYVFFRELAGHDARLGPLGAQGLALTPFRSIAVDRTLYSYGLPFFIVGDLPQASGLRSFRQLAIAQDTGSAIVGAARIDLFAGSDKAAEELAGLLQNHIDLYLLRPKNSGD